MRRTLTMVGLAVAAVLWLPRPADAQIQDSLKAILHLQGASLKPRVVLTWRDTVNNVVRTDVFRKDTLPDTAFKKIGVIYGRPAQEPVYIWWWDDNAVKGHSYAYKIQDSVSGTAIKAATDTVHVHVP